MKKHNKIKLAVVISIISVLIAIISLLISVYMGAKEIQYKENAKKMQEISQELQKRGFEFDENYKKIDLAEKSITEQMENCKISINESELNRNLKLLISARSALIKNDYALASAYLNKVDEEGICSLEKGQVKNTVYWEIGILVFIWIALLVALIRVIKK